jgi:hypothetical protein
VAGNPGAQPDYSAADEREQILLSVLMESRSLRIRTLADPELPLGQSIFGDVAAASHSVLPLLVDPASLRHLLVALRKRGWAPTPTRARGLLSRGLLPPLAVELAHAQRSTTLALYSFVPGLRGDPEEAFDLLWDKRLHRTLRATAVPVVDVGVVASTADARPLPSARYTSARLVVDFVSDPMRWCLAYVESPAAQRKELRRLAAEWYRGNGTGDDVGSAAWRLIKAFLGARHRWARIYGV